MNSSAANVEHQIGLYIPVICSPLEYFLEYRFLNVALINVRFEDLEMLSDNSRLRIILTFIYILL